VIKSFFPLELAFPNPLIYRFSEMSFSSLSSLTKLRSIGKDMVPLSKPRFCEYFSKIIFSIALSTQGDGSPKGVKSAKIQMTRDSIMGKSSLSCSEK